MKDEEGNLVDKWTPCSPGDPSAVEKTWTDIGEKELQEPPLGVSHFNAKLTSSLLVFTYILSL